MTKASGKFKFAHISIWEDHILSLKEFKNLKNLEQMLYLCKLGHLAPSSHNTQPWRYFIDEASATIVVFLDREFILPISDVVGRQAVLSMGCCLENISIACSYYGISTKIVYHKINKDEVLPNVSNKTSRYIKIFSITLKQKIEPNKKADPLFNAIFTRKAMRAEFDPKIKIPNEIIKHLKSFFIDKDIELNFINDPIKRLTLSEFQGQADGFVINSPNFAKELGEWLLPNNSKKAIGMPGVGFGLQDKEALRMHLGLTGSQQLQPEDGLRFALGGKIAIEKSPLICLLSIKKDEPNEWLLAGQKFERMFLFLESKGFSVAVHAAVVEVELINRVFAASLGTKKRLCVLFRTGKVKEKNNLLRPHSPRQDIKNVILKSLPSSK